MQNTAYGITSTDDGLFWFVAIKKHDKTWRISSQKTWDSTSVLKNALLLHRGVVAAVPCSFKRPEARHANEQDIVYPQEISPLVPYTYTPMLSPFNHYLSANCIAVVPDDAFLATIPLAFAGHEVHSFASVFQTATTFKIGLIVNKSLQAVFTMSPATPETLQSHLARIERYCSIISPELIMPRHIYSFNCNTESLAQGHFHFEALSLPREIISSKETAIAFGAALANVECKIPALSFDASRASFRKLRAFGYAASLAFLGSIIVCALFFAGASVYSSISLAKYKTKYQTILRQNPDIKKLLDENESFAKELLSLSTVVANRTGWADFLQLLGTKRPIGLYFEMLGSEALNKSTGTARIALSGYASNESLITDFISSLQNSNIVSQVSLSSMERDKTRNVVTYKVICLLKCTALSKTK